MRYALTAISVVGVVAGAYFLYVQNSLQPRLGKSRERIMKSDEEWKKQLTPEQYYVTRQKGTERAGTGKYVHCNEDGVYACVCCGQPLFDANTKYDSCTGWPSFWQPVDNENVSLIEDNSLFSRRIEVVCSRCGAHLGHVFGDGPQPTGQRYCMNSAALNLVKRPEKAEDK
jgi:peptide-methionine (R)-S-oxide reductase